METDPTTGNEIEVEKAVATDVGGSGPDKKFVSRYWNYVMLHIREWNFRYVLVGHRAELPIKDEDMAKMEKKVHENDLPYEDVK